MLTFQVQVPTPPGSNKADELFPSTLVVRPPRGSGGVRPEELSKMFPTPPSHEHNPISSPCGHNLGDTPVHEPADLMPSLPLRVKQEHHSYPNLGSPQEEPIEVCTDHLSFEFLQEMFLHPPKSTLDQALCTKWGWSCILWVSKLSLTIISKKSSNSKKSSKSKESI